MTNLGWFYTHELTIGARLTGKAWYRLKNNCRVLKSRNADEKNNITIVSHNLHMCNVNGVSGNMFVMDISSLNYLAS